ncbi:MAG: ASKHA domain-containing protein, partial [Methylobacter sp.]
TGAVCRVSKDDGQWRLQTLGEAPARGYCGSGFIDAIALLLEEKLLKPSGRFAEPQPGGGYLLDAENPRTAICPADVDIFQRAKASTAAAMIQLLVYAGLKADDLQTLWICGSFGQHLDLDSAMRVGLLPVVDQERVRLLANAGLAGCEKLLLDPDAQALLNDIVSRARVVNLGGIFEYEERFIDNLRLQPVLTTEC